MRFSISTYIPGSSPLHRLDARVKVLLLLAYSVTLFLVTTWWGLLASFALLAAAWAVSGVPLRRVLGCGATAYALIGAIVALNALRGWEGALHGCFLASRILLLLWASYLVCFTSTSTDLSDALASLLGPLRRIGVPVDDVALTLSLALRFIPETSAEVDRVKRAQLSRCAPLGEGHPFRRMVAWGAVLAPVMAALFRRADRLALALDARCYGLQLPEASRGRSQRRTSLASRRWSASGAIVLALGCALCAALAWWL